MLHGLSATARWPDLRRDSRWPHEVSPRLIGAGRPLGPVARAVLGLLARRTLTAHEVAQQLMLSRMAAKYTCSRLEAGGYLRVVDRIKVTGAHKPVRLYTAAALAADAAQPAVFTHGAV